MTVNFVKNRTFCGISTSTPRKVSTKALVILRMLFISLALPMGLNFAQSNRFVSNDTEIVYRYTVKDHRPF